MLAHFRKHWKRKGDERHKEGDSWRRNRNGGTRGERGREEERKEDRRGERNRAEGDAMIGRGIGRREEEGKINKKS